MIWLNVRLKEMHMFSEFYSLLLNECLM